MSIINAIFSLILHKLKCQVDSYYWYTWVKCGAFKTVVGSSIILFKLETKIRRTDKEWLLSPFVVIEKILYFSPLHHTLWGFERPPPPPPPLITPTPYTHIEAFQLQAEWILPFSHNIKQFGKNALYLLISGWQATCNFPGWYSKIILSPRAWNYIPKPRIDKSMQNAAIFSTIFSQYFVDIIWSIAVQTARILDILTPFC